MKLIQHSQLSTYINVAYIVSLTQVHHGEYFRFEASMVNGDKFYWSFGSELDAMKAHERILELIEAEK